MIVRWPHHKRREGCSLADGCSRCGAVTIFELTTHCIGRVLEPIERTAVRNGHLDYAGLTWVTASDLAGLTADEVREQEFFKP